jgi:hypothetical protein
MRGGKNAFGRFDQTRDLGDHVLLRPSASQEQLGFLSNLNALVVSGPVRRNLSY